MKILYLHLNLNLGALFTPRKTLVLETLIGSKFSIIFAHSPNKKNQRNDAHTFNFLDMKGQKAHIFNLDMKGQEAKVREYHYLQLLEDDWWKGY